MGRRSAPVTACSCISVWIVSNRRTNRSAIVAAAPRIERRPLRWRVDPRYRAQRHVRLAVHSPRRNAACVPKCRRVEPRTHQTIATPVQSFPGWRVTAAVCATDAKSPPLTTSRMPRQRPAPPTVTLAGAVQCPLGGPHRTHREESRPVVSWPRSPDGNRQVRTTTRNGPASCVCSVTLMPWPSRRPSAAKDSSPGRSGDRESSPEVAPVRVRFDQQRRSRPHRRGVPMPTSSRLASPCRTHQ